MEKIIASVCADTCHTPMAEVTDDSKLQPVVMKLPWLGVVSNRFRLDIEAVMIKACPWVKPRICFTTRHVFNGIHKDVLPATSISSVVYQYTCYCDQQCVGKTIQVLAERIKQHVPKKLINQTKAMKIDRCDSVITKHLKENPSCIPEQPAERFKILTQARTQMHLDMLEAIFIKSLTPGLCQQKDFTRTLHLT